MVIEGDLKKRCTSVLFPEADWRRAETTHHPGRQPDGQIVTSGGEFGLTQQCCLAEAPWTSSSTCLQSARLHQRGVSLSCRSKRNRSSYCRRIHVLRMDESRIAPRNGWDRLKGISEWTKSELCCTFTPVKRPTCHQGKRLVSLHQCVAFWMQI